MSAIESKADPAGSPLAAEVRGDRATEAAALARYRDRPGVVLVYAAATGAFVHAHERAARTTIARRLAALKGYAFAGEHEPGRHYPGPVYLVPSDTLVGLEAARALGVNGEHDLFGGVVPHAFVATKVITHPLVARRPRPRLAGRMVSRNRVRDAVLTGLCGVHARAMRSMPASGLLARGPVRLKPACATGGRGQSVVADAAALDAALRSMDAAELARDGAGAGGEPGRGDDPQRRPGARGGAGGQLLRHAAADAGQPRRAGLWRLRPPASCAAASTRCSGSSSRPRRGSRSRRRRPTTLPPRRNFRASSRRAATTTSPRAATPGAAGAPACSSSPGASAAPAAPRSPRSRRSGPIRRCGPCAPSTVELYGEGHTPPPRATVYFQGTDAKVGPITKYALVKPDADAR